MLRRTVSFFAFLLSAISLGLPLNTAAADIKLYTPFTKISVPPGESIDYTIDIKNDGNETRNVNISVIGMPKDWQYSMKSGLWTVNQISVQPGQTKNVNLKVDVPLKVNKGNYRFRVVAEGYDELPLTVNVSEQGTYRTEFTTSQINMEGHSESTFTFNANLKNQTGEKQLYSLRAVAPRGWIVTFKPDYKQATSVEINPNETKNITIDINPPQYIEAGKYQIPVSAVTNMTTATLNLEVVITGTFKIELTTPTGILSTDITAGDEKRVELLVKNTGSALVKGVKLTATKPANWDVIFNPAQIDELEAGKSAQVFATIKADEKAIAGDYVTTMTASIPEVSSSASFRVSVKTPMLWGWVGILIIMGALASVYYLFRKYGRR
jgi:uncharacterized membrane protein